MLDSGLPLQFALPCSLAEFRETEIVLVKHQRDWYHIEPSCLGLFYLFRPASNLFDADLENDLAGDSYGRLDADLHVRRDLLFVHLVIEARGNYNRGYGDDEGSQFPGGVGAGCPGLLPCCDRPESLVQIARPVENGEQMVSDVRLKSKVLQQSTEYFLGFEDYAPLDICCPLVYVVVPA